MPAFDAKTLDSDPDGLALLAAVLHPSKQARAEAVARGRERLAHTFAEAMAAKPCANAACLAGTSAR